jgi:outer membrane lipoprotein SlyB
MTKIIRIAFLSAGLALLAGCATEGTVHTKERAVMGGLGGAVLGGVIGHQSGRGLEGAAVGAAAGSAAGAVSGSAQDEKEAEARRR